MSAFVVCGACHYIRGGPIGVVDGVKVLQLCGCSTTEEHRAQPHKGDVNLAFELCYCCGLEALRSGSRWSVWFREACKDRVRALDSRTGRSVVPIGRHSLMNQVVFNPAADLDVAVTAFTDQQTSMIDKIIHTRAWAASAVRLNRVAVGLPAGEDIDLDAYLAAVETLTPVKAERFIEMVGLLGMAGSPAASRRWGS